MAINQTDVARAATEKLVIEVTKLLTSLDTIEAIQESIAGAAIDLATYETEFESIAELRHCNTATYKDVLNIFVPQIKVALSAYYSGTPTQQAWSALMKVRR